MKKILYPSVRQYGRLDVMSRRDIKELTLPRDLASSLPEVFVPPASFLLYFPFPFSHSLSLFLSYNLSIYRFILRRHFCLSWRRIVAADRGYTTEAGSWKLIFLGEPWLLLSASSSRWCHFVSCGIAGIPAGYTRILELSERTKRLLGLAGYWSRSRYCSLSVVICSMVTALISRSSRYLLSISCHRLNCPDECRLPLKFGRTSLAKTLDRREGRILTATDFSSWNYFHATIMMFSSGNDNKIK